MNLEKKRALVVGLAKSGLAAARLLSNEGAIVTVTDQKSKSGLRDFLKLLPKKTHLKLGRDSFDARSYDLIVTSPGVPWDHPQLEKARKAGIPVWPELELGWQFARPFRTIAVTGTNGKTTTTALIGHLIKSSGRKVVVGGNIGTPLSELISTITPQSYLVLEVSSYQLEAQQSFHPNVGVFLNLTPDHLKRHGTMAGYAKAKARLFINSTSKDYAVLNKSDVWCRRVAAKIRAKKVWFPNPFLKKLAANIRLPGQHNLENAMAAAGAVLAAGIPAVEIIRGLKTFKGVPHRIQIIRERQGVTFVNDSKATNVDSTIVALKSFSAPIHLILGGEHKGTPYKPLIPLLKKNVRRIYTIGDAAPLVEKDLARVVPIVRSGTLKKAVSDAAANAVRGDVVLLSPACASFDQFRNFEHRGESFVNFVKAL